MSPAPSTPAEPGQPLAARPRLRVLFIGEGATLAHAARPLALAGALSEDRYEAIIATPERYRTWVPSHVEWRPLDAQSPEQFAERLTSGRPLYSGPRLESYVTQDLELIAAVRPDVVVGDFRLSLAPSGRSGLQYAFERLM